MNRSEIGRLETQRKPKIVPEISRNVSQTQTLNDEVAMKGLGVLSHIISYIY